MGDRLRVVLDGPAAAHGSAGVDPAEWAGAFELVPDAPDALLLAVCDSSAAAERLAASRARFPAVPVVVLAPEGAPTALEDDLHRLGAADVVRAEHASRLPFAVRRAVEEGRSRARAEAELRARLDALDAASAERESRQAETAERDRALFDRMTEGFALHEIICDESTGRPVDYRFLEVNPAFERLTGLARADVVGRRVSEVLPAVEPLWIERYGRVALTGEPARFEERAATLGRHYEVFAYRTRPGQFAVLFSDTTERHVAALRLRESERVYRAIGESIDYGVWVCAPDGRNIYASPSFLALVGMTQEQCSGFGWGDVLHPDDAARTIAAWQECVRTGGVWDIEHRYRGVDGAWHAILARGVPVRDDQGRILCWAGINLDISRLKATEQALRESREDLNRAQAVARTGSWRVDVPGSRLAWSDETHRLFGIPPGTPLTYEAFLSRVHPDDRERVDRAWRDALAGAPYDIEHRIVVDGEVRWVRERAELEQDPAGAVLGGFGTVQDVTERVESAERLRAYAELLEHAPVLARDDDDRIVVWTSGMEALYGFSRVEALGREVHELLRTEPPRPLSEIRAVLERRGRWEGELRRRRRDGTPVVVHSLWLPHQGPVGPHAVIEVDRDITQRKQLEEQLERRVEERTAALAHARERLQQLSRKLVEVQESERRWVARELHDEAGQSLTAIKLQLAVLSRGVAPGGELSTRLDELRGTVDDVMQGLHALCVRLNPVALERLGLARALAQLANAAASSGVEVACSVAGLEEEAISSEAAVTVYRAVQEALTNVVRHARARHVTVTVDRDRDRIAFAVADDGVGFDAEQAASSGRLGLSGIVERVELVGGSVTIESAPGRGTRIAGSLRA